MNRNPYAAPESKVAVPVNMPRQRPKEVAYAVWLQWISITLSVISLLIYLAQHLAVEPISPVTLVGFLVAGALVVGQCLLLVWLTLRVAVGQGWARWALLAVAAFNLLMLLLNLQTVLAAYRKTPLLSVLDGINFVLGFVLVGLLFTPRARAWFKASRDA